MKISPAVQSKQHLSPKIQHALQELEQLLSGTAGAESCRIYGAQRLQLSFSLSCGLAGSSWFQVGWMFLPALPWSGKRPSGPLSALPGPLHPLTGCDASPWHWGVVDTGSGRAKGGGGQYRVSIGVGLAGGGPCFSLLCFGATGCVVVCGRGCHGLKVMIQGPVWWQCLPWRPREGNLLPLGLSPPPGVCRGESVRSRCA